MYRMVPRIALIILVFFVLVGNIYLVSHELSLTVNPHLTIKQPKKHIILAFRPRTICYGCRQIPYIPQIIEGRIIGCPGAPPQPPQEFPLPSKNLQETIFSISPLPPPVAYNPLIGCKSEIFYERNDFSFPRHFTSGPHPNLSYLLPVLPPPATKNRP